MLRTLRACGVSARMLNSVLLVELVSLALVAGVVGLVCGYGIAASLLPDVAASLRGLYGARIPGQLTLEGEWWMAGLAISVFGALAAAAASLTKAIRLPVLAAAQPYAWQQAQHRWLIIQSAVALAVLAACLPWHGDSLLSGFAVLAALLLAAALLLPAILERVLSLGQRSARRPLAVWFWADSRQQLSGLSLALMALLLALAVNVGVGTMVESFSRTFVGWLDGRLAATSMSTPRRCAGDRDQDRCAAVRKSRRSFPAAGPTCNSAARRSRCWACLITPPIVRTGPCLNPAPTPGFACGRAMPR
jgi:putative ABC transport system permease protein